ncbi:membrane bound O-acyltransferase domain containing 7, partial [Chelydra serpentina]
MVSLANEVQEFSQAKKQDVTSFAKGPAIGLIPSVPGLGPILCYSYCYVGLMTGPFYRATGPTWTGCSSRTHRPSSAGSGGAARLVPVYGLLFLGCPLFPLGYVRSEAFAARALPFRLFYMVPVFFVFRMRFYVAWLCAECACIAAAFGAYPTAARARPGGGPTTLCPSAEEGARRSPVRLRDHQEHRPYGTDFCVEGRMRYWNMSVQWWLAQYIYKERPLPLLRHEERLDHADLGLLARPAPRLLPQLPDHPAVPGGRGGAGGGAAGAPGGGAGARPLLGGLAALVPQDAGVRLHVHGLCAAGAGRHPALLGLRLLLRPPGRPGPAARGPR